MDSNIFVIMVFLIQSVFCALENNPIRMRRLFLGELQLVKDLTDLQTELLEAQETLPNPLLLYLHSHKNVEREFEGTEYDTLLKLFSLNENSTDAFSLIDDKLVGNVLHIYLLTRRIANYLEELLIHVNQNILISTVRDSEKEKWLKSLKTVEQLEQRLHMAEQSDLNMAMLALARVQHVYQIPTSKLTAGILGTRKTKARLTADDCFRIGTQRMEVTYPLTPASGPMPEYALAIEWLEIAHTLSVAHYGVNNDYTVFIENYLIDVRRQHDEHFIPMSPGDGPTVYPNEHFFISPIGLNRRKITGKVLRMKEKQVMEERFGGEINEEGYSRRDFFTLCRGEKIKLRHIQESGELNCQLETRNDPFLLIQPLKVETLQQDPFEAYIFHDVISPGLMQRMKELVIETGEMQVAKMFNVSNPEVDLHSTDRTQTNAWLFEGTYPELLRLSKYLDHITELQVSFEHDPASYTRFVESEDYQVGLYAPGGLYLCHMDAMDSDFIKMHDDLYIGDRIATLMFYLSNVDGGRTAFPKVGIAATPSSGSAVFWYNLNRDGSLNTLSTHGGCPVLYGIKWVSNKWIREGSQLFKRPCLLDYEPAVVPPAIILNDDYDNEDEEFLNEYNNFDTELFERLI